MMFHHGEVVDLFFCVCVLMCQRSVGMLRILRAQFLQLFCFMAKYFKDGPR